MKIFPFSLFNFETDSERLAAQKQALQEIYAQHGIDHNQMRAEIRRGNLGYLKSLNPNDLQAAEAHKWVLENAAIRGRKEGFNIWGLLHLMRDFRSRSRKENE